MESPAGLALPLGRPRLTCAPPPPPSQVLYVMEVQQDQERGRASFTAVSEFLLTHPVLSFGLQDVSCCRLQPSEVLPPDEDSESMTTGGSRSPTPTRVPPRPLHVFSVITAPFSLRRKPGWSGRV